MKRFFLVLGLLAAAVTSGMMARDAKPLPAPQQAANVPPPNPAIDMDGYLKVAAEAAEHRKTRRVSEDDFLRMSRDKGTIVLDARSKEMFDLLHVKGAVNLSFPNIDIESLEKTLPDKNVRILIYCNNNFTDPTAPAPTPQAKGQQPDANAVARAAFAPKRAVASLNISTFISLYSYGYKNVYELAPLIEPAKTKLTLEPTRTAAR